MDRKEEVTEAAAAAKPPQSTRQQLDTDSDSDSDAVGPAPLPPPLSPLHRELKHGDIAVGDGGRGWREKAVKRRAQLQQQSQLETGQPSSSASHTAVSLNRQVLPMYGTQKNKQRGWMQQPSSSRASTSGFNRNIEARDKDKRDMGEIEEKSFDFKNKKRHEHHIELRPPVSTTIEEMEKPTSGLIYRDRKSCDQNHDHPLDEKLILSSSPLQGVRMSEEKEDANLLASKALKCLMAGDMVNYNRLEAEKTKLMTEGQKEAAMPTASSSTMMTKPSSSSSHKGEKSIKVQEKVCVLEDVDAQGRYLPLLEFHGAKTTIAVEGLEQKREQLRDVNQKLQRR